MQEGDRVGDMLVVVVLGVEKGQHVAAETPLLFLPLLNPKPPTHPALSPHLICVKAPQAPQYILEVIL